MVYIECLIMEVNLDKDFNLGTEWTAAGETTYNGYEGAYGGGFSGQDPGYSNIAGMGGGITGVGTFPPACLWACWENSSRWGGSSSRA